MKRIGLLLAGLLVASCTLPASTGCSGEQTSTKLVVFEAGSLLVPFEAIEKAFESKYPHIDVLMEGHGSIQVIRHVTEIHDDIDVVAVADYSLIPLLMYPTLLPNTTESYADWTIQFAGNRLGIAYTDDSLYSDEIDAGNWFEILNREEVRLGLADPRLDAVGYRTLMIAQLAEAYYDDNTIFENLFTFNLTGPVRSLDEGNGFNIVVPELIEARTRHIALRGFSVQLLSLLEAGQIDYAFEYESVAEQHGLNFLALPPEIDFSREEFQDLYSTVKVTLDFRRFASVTPVFLGEPIFYGITIPASASHPDEAALFIEFLLSAEGQAIMNEHSHPPLIPPRCDNPASLPDDLKNLFR
ncbi:tungstate ABC transporter substrate-binding protein WtpA [Dehalogenimonas sp. THU2]|uniref:tungstate ABC transporter substrate-binding protein WtpA n=1 Tax=Dehalogenimonas sp. THU2 TaxID=3151121 RepID=UPI003218224F